MDSVSDLARYPSSGDEGNLPPMAPAGLDEVLTLFRQAQDVGAPNLYANGFTNLVSGADICSVLTRNGRVEAVLNLSFTSAKTLSIALGQLVSEIESKSNRDLMTVEDVLSLFSTAKEG